MPDGTEVGKVFLGVGFNSNDINRGLNRVQQTAQRGSSGIMNTLGKIGAAVGVAFSINKIKQFGLSCIELASDLQEVQNVVDVTFGKAASQINDFADTAAKSFGLSEYTAKQFTGTMGAMLKSTGLTTDAAKDMSIQLAKLSGDVASFYNITTEEAFQKIRSGMSGETESLKQLGINLNVANVEAFALAQGIKKSFNEMSYAEQTLLRYNYLMSVTADAQGDFARTSGSWANQTRIMTLQIETLKASLGQGFMLAVQPALGALNVLLGKIIQVANTFSDVLAKVFGIETVTYSVGSGLGDVADNGEGVAASIGGIGTAAGSTAKKLKGMLAGFDQLNILNTDTSGGGGGGGGGSVPNFGVGTTSPNSSQTNAILDAQKSLEDLGAGFGSAQNTAANAVSGINDNMSTMEKWIRIVKEGIDNAKTSWGNFKTSFDNFITEVVDPVMLSLTGMTSDEFFWNFIEKSIESIGPGLQNFADFFDMLTALFTGTKEEKLAAFEKWFDSLKEVGQINFEKLGLKKFLDEVIELGYQLGLIYGTVQGVIATVGSFAGEIVGKVITPFINASTRIKLIFSEVKRILITKIDEALTRIKEVFSPIVEFFQEKIDLVKGTFTDVKTSAYTSFKSAYDKIKEVFNPLAEYFEDTFAIIKNKFTAFGTTVGAALGGAFKAAIKSALTSGINAINKVIDTINAFRGFINVLLPPYAKIPQMARLKVPALAEGGIITKPTLAMMGENNKKEAVIPLDRNTEWMDMLVGRLAAQNQGGGGGDITINTYVDGTLVYTSVKRRDEIMSIRSNGRNNM